MSTTAMVVLALFVGASLGAFFMAILVAGARADERPLWTPTDDRLDEWEEMLELGLPLAGEHQLHLIGACRRLKRANEALLVRALRAEGRLEELEQPEPRLAS